MWVWNCSESDSSGVSDLWDVLTKGRLSCVKTNSVDLPPIISRSIQKKQWRMISERGQTKGRHRRNGKTQKRQQPERGICLIDICFQILEGNKPKCSCHNVSFLPTRTDARFLDWPLYVDLTDPGKTAEYLQNLVAHKPWELLLGVDLPHWPRVRLFKWKPIVPDRKEHPSPLGIWTEDFKEMTPLSSSPWLCWYWLYFNYNSNNII